MPGQAPDTAMRTGTGKAIPSHNHISTDTTTQVVMIHTEVIQGHDIGIIATTTGVVHDAQIPDTGVIAINPTTTHHINPATDRQCTEAHHHIEITHVHIHPTNLQDEIHIGHTHTPADHEVNCITGGTPE